MKPASPDSTTELRPASRRRGFALVLVISMLALLMVLMLAFLSLGQDDARLSHAHIENNRANWVAQSAVNTAMAQLREATSQTFETGAPKPWTSQPGAIRVHRMNGTLETLYKLYSAPSMTAAALADTANDLPDDWAAQPGRFVDLNAPLALPGGGLHFPVVDPRAKTTDAQSWVEGFDYEEVAGAIGPGGDASAQRLPMPVQWIYQLRDGQMGTLDADGHLIMFAPDSEPSVQNPIVARFAFWVDDETSKINVNTAAEGSFWDSPRADSSQERLLATTVPSRLEYARQPGHPAGVCLSSVLLPGRRLYPAGFPVVDSTMETLTVEDAQDLWRMGRLIAAEENEGTSFGGTRLTDWTSLWDSQPRPRARQARYIANHEVLFDVAGSSPGQNLQASMANGSPAGERRAITGIFSRHPDALERLRRGGFFLTTTSSAPEVTLYGTPRVATWPAHAQTLDNNGNLDQEPRRDTAHNHKIKLAAMLKGQPWFVVRSEPGNGMNDFDRHGRGVNRQLYDYLQRITSRPIPGYQRAGYSTFEAKYGEDRDSILLGIMDYIRASNFADGQLAGTMQFSILCPGVEHHGFGQVSPLQFRVRSSEMGTSNHARGLGRTPAISEVALVISCRAEVVEGAEGQPEIQGQPSEAGRAQLTQIGDRELEVGFMVELFVPGHGWTDYCPFITAGMFGGKPGAEPRTGDAFPQMQLNDQPLVPYGTGGRPRSRISSAEFPPAGWHGAGGAIGMRALSEGALVFRPVVVKANTDGTLPPLQFRGTGGQAEQIKIALYDVPESTDRADLLQVVPLILPDIGYAQDGDSPPRLELPRLPPELADPLLENRLHLASLQRQPLLSAEDVVQSLSPLHGDYRLTASQRWVESRSSTAASPIFTAHPAWGTQRHAHDLRDSFLPPSASVGYIPGLAHPTGTGPDIPATLAQPDAGLRLWGGTGWEMRTLQGALDSLRLDGGARGDALPWITGDFDNGYANSPDGPYMNRPDDGHWAAATRTGTTPYFDNISQTGPRVPPVSPAAFCPQRLIPSPVMFGSLPTGTRTQVPWQTLLFRPQPGHYGAESPPDHLLLDLFWTPVIEPEPISQKFETAGKINLNHQLLPFRHITRATALHAAMKAETLMAIPDEAAAAYKSGAEPERKYRRHIDTRRTLALWKENVFDQGQVFLTASQICEQHLVPEGFSGSVSNTEMQNYWSQHRLTGDNTRERPYAHLYSRLTTRSNSYRVHFIAQTVTKARSTAPDTFDPARDRVTATRQGSAILRRQLDLDHPSLPDYLTEDDAPPLDSFYHWQVSPLDWE